MQSNKLRMAIRATAAVAVLGIAGQAQAFNFTAGDVDASIYGYARLSMSYDIDQDISDGTQSGNANSIVHGNDIDGFFGASAAQSRLGFKATNSDGLTVNIEGDFASTFRLRHAYGSYKGVLAGQTWSNYNSFVGSTPTLDFNGVAGNAGYQVRTAQLRYTTGPMSFSIEDPQNKGIPSQRDGSPAFTARLEDKAGGFAYAASGLVKQNTADNGTDDDSTLGFGVFGAASMALSDMISLQGAINYTNGASGYLYLSGGSDAYLDGNSLENISGVGGTLGASFKLGNGRSFNVAYGMTKLDVDDLVSDTVATGSGTTETNQTVFVNYMWTPVKNTMMGVEYGYFDNEKQNGDSEDANRIMFAAQYNF